MATSEASYNELKVQLEDAQTSLAAALARIETLKIREKILNQEVAHLRKQLSGDKSGSRAGSKPPTPRDPSPPPTQPTPPLNTEDADEEDGTQNNILVGMPTYITELKDQQPVQIHVGNKRVSGSVVVTKEYIDFVEVKARIQREEFVGITSAKQEHTAKTPLSPKTKSSVGCFAQFCMAAPATAEDEADQESSPAERRSSWAGAGASAAAASASARGGLPPTGRDFKSWQALGLAQRTSSYQPVSPEDEPPGVYQILWHGAEATNRITFEATRATREVLHRHTERWMSKVGSDDEDVVVNGEVEIVPPRHLIAASDATATPLQLSEPSAIIEQSHADALAAALPGRFKLRSWQLVYSTSRHGISLATLFRKAAGLSPCILIVRDGGGHVFGAFTAEPWRIAPRFYGTGETFVFQLEPHRVMYPWKVKSRIKNEYFMYGTPDCLGVGGAGHFALWLDNELLHGHSGACGTFGSPCLAHKEEFKVMGVELWNMV